MEKFKEIKILEQENQTPFYCYFESMLKKKYELLKINLPGKFGILYSLKANSNREIVNSLARLGAGCDVSSIHELEVALQSGTRPQDISYTGPGKCKEEIIAFLQLRNGFINIESLEELKTVISLNPEDSKVKIMLRISWPEEKNQFGMDIEEIKSILAQKELASKIHGFHSFWRSQILEASTLLKHYKRTLELAIKLKEQFGFFPEYINFGSGIGIPYFTGDKEFEVKAFFNDLRLLMKELSTDEKLKNTQFLIESGRFLTCDSGHYVTKVLYKKENYGKKIAIVDGGFHQFMAATGMGQILKRPFPILKIGEAGEMEKVTIAGKSCSPQDVFAHDIELPHLVPGDLVCIGNAGAYGLSYSPLGFNGHRPPREIFVPAL